MGGVCRIVGNSGEGIRDGADLSGQFDRIVGESATALVERSHENRFARFDAASIFLVLPQPSFENVDRGQEVVAVDHHQIDVVEVLTAAEAVGEVVAWIDGRTQFFAGGTLKSKVVVALLCNGTVATESGDGERHWQVVTDRPQ